jgi:GH24 family phage-related lysozyme (muramidase)
MDKGIELIKKWEGLRLNAYLCPAKVPTIGYGSTRMNGKPVKLGQRLKDESEAERLLKSQIINDFLPSLQKIPVWRHLSRNQQGALLSFAWNLGAEFYDAKGFETITKALKEDLNAVPEALMLYVKGGGKTLQGLVNRRKEEGELWLEPVNESTVKEAGNPIDLIKYPTSVKVSERFVIVGKFYDGDKSLKVIADGKFPLPDCKVKDGVIDYELTLNTVGSRNIAFKYLAHSASVDIAVIDSSNLGLKGSVGQGGKNNHSDVKSVQQRLKDLGYPIGDVDGICGNKTIQMIRLFQSIISGQSTVNGDGRVDVNGKTHQWLQAKNAPKWQVMPNTNAAISFRNQELEETWDHHDYGTNWLTEMVLWIAKDYHNTYRSKAKGSSAFSINDASLPHGGNTPDHSGHETGLAVDIFLPRKDGLNGGIDYLDSRYDRAASEAVLRSINRCPLVNKSRIFFNDPYLVQKGLCKSVRGHHHHYHVEVIVPNIQS